MFYENLKNMFINNIDEQEINDFLMNLDFEELQEITESNNKIEVIEDGNPREDLVIAIMEYLLNDLNN